MGDCPRSTQRRGSQGTSYTAIRTYTPIRIVEGYAENKIRPGQNRQGFPALRRRGS